jgi:hypothetical protein
MISQGFRVWTVWEWEHWRYNGGQIGQINAWKDGNVCTIEGLNYLLNVGWPHSGWDSDDYIDTWYLCVFEDDYTPLETDTYVSPGYSEVDTLQDTASRPTFQPGVASGKSKSNVLNKASFTFALNTTIYGGSMVGGSSGSVIGGTAPGSGPTNVLFCASKFSAGSQLIVAGDVIKVTVTLNAASG